MSNRSPRLESHRPRKTTEIITGASAGDKAPGGGFIASASLSQGPRVDSFWSLRFLGLLWIGLTASAPKYTSESMLAGGGTVESDHHHPS
jgi:hypothetical protein